MPHNAKSEGREVYKNLINIYEGNLNENYIPKKPRGNELSSTWLKNANSATLERLKRI